MEVGIHNLAYLFLINNVLYLLIFILVLLITQKWVVFLFASLAI